MLQQPLPEPSIVNLVAILPFRIANANPELAWLREGLMDLLAIKLAGEGGLRVAEPRAVLGAWGRAGGSLGQEVTSQAARAIARGLGAGRIIDGAVVGFAGRLTLTASLLDTHDGRTTARASVEGPADSLPMLTDRLTAQLLSLAAGTEARRLASISSGSLPAIRAYLAGRAAFRQGRLREAFNAFREATILDSTFALAALELVHASKWVALNGEEAQRGSRLALAGRERLAPGERALLDAWVSPGYTRPEVIQSWRRATIAYPDRADLWYGLGDVYYHEGTLAGLADPFELAGDAFQRGWALDSASGVDSQSHQRAPIFAEPLSHMLEIAQTRGDTASVGRLVRLGLAADSTSAQGWYLRWHRALAGGLAGARSFWADSQRMDPEALPRIHRFSAWTGIAPQDYLLSADLMLRRRALDDPDAVQFERHVLALNGGRPQEAAREMAGNLDAPGVSIGLPVREALYWDGDTSVAAEAVLRMVPSAVQVAPRGAAQQSHLQSLCTLATWRLAHGDVRYAEMATRQLQRAVVAGLALSDSIAVAQYASLCAALLEATRATALRLPNARSALEQADTAVQISYVGQSLGANLVVARAAEAQGNLPFALRAVRRRAGGYGLLPMWYLSTFLREEGRLAAMTGDIAGSVRAYQQYLALRPNPEPAVKLEVDRVRAELARLAGDDAAGSAGAYPRSRATIGRVQAGRREAP
jgi:TolB-like protein